MGVFRSVFQHANFIKHGQAALIQIIRVIEVMQSRGQHQVFQHCLMGKQVEALKNHSKPGYLGTVRECVFALSCMNKCTSQQLNTTLIHFFQTIDHADQRGFS
ncbi:Uncharacterised protein [Klebsiella pneumoniae]|nr:Uncharacterised protein [Klebsiella pneumoniae]